MVDRICDNCMSRVPADAEKCPKCGIRFENTNPGGALPNGWVLGGRYTIGRYIDIDGEGVTYSAIDGDTLQRVTIKEYMPVTLCASRTQEGEIMPKPGCEVLFKTTRMDFLELYTTLSGIGLSEGLVHVLDVLEANNTAYAVLEKIEGPTLAEYLTRMQEPMETNRVLTMLRPILVGVETLHAANVVHRGISPDNIILESGGTAKLGGYATLALRQHGSELKPKLYPGYSAPEQYSATEFEGRYTDVYALGAVLYRMLTGDVPPLAEERKMQDTLRAPRAVVKEIPAFLSTGIAKAMRINSSERIQSVSDLRMALSGESMRGGTAPMPAMKEKGGYPFGLTKQQMVIGAAALGAVVLIFLVVLLAVSLGKGGTTPVPSSTLVSSVAEVKVPDFKGKKYSELSSNSAYSKFALEVSHEYSDTVAAGIVVSQTPEAGTAWDGKAKIKLVVSDGKEPAELPDYAGKNVDEVKADLKKMGFTDEEILETRQDNDGSYEENAVIKTDPVPGTKVSPGKDKIMLIIASAASSTSMPDIKGDTKEKAINMLVSYGLKKENISTVTVANDKGRQANNTVVSTNPSANIIITPGSQKVELTLYEEYKMPSLDRFVGQPSSEIVRFCDEHGIPYNSPVTVPNDGTKVEGIVAKIEYTSNVVVNDGTIVVIKVYGPPPVASAPPQQVPAG